MRVQTADGHMWGRGIEEKRANEKDAEGGRKNEIVAQLQLPIVIECDDGQPSDQIYVLQQTVGDRSCIPYGALDRCRSSN
jgi:hypothetical protein